MNYAQAYDSMNARRDIFRHSCMQTKQITTFYKSLISFLLIFRVEWQEMYTLRVKLVDPNAKIPTNHQKAQLV